MVGIINEQLKKAVGFCLDESTSYYVIVRSTGRENNFSYAIVTLKLRLIYWMARQKTPTIYCLHVEIRICAAIGAHITILPTMSY